MNSYSIYMVHTWMMEIKEQGRGYDIRAHDSLEVDE